ncbi:uroporphyrinogen-III synthase [Microbacterium sp. EYE_5]|uniref:uroporphyrinogen-III synthase n=1 Tax=unclassified Microbacterium TaxID=2609290 RepID=UPI002003D6D7|nr:MULTISPECIES: uroporphyrinogen-III synthase [unclassified Microbacterium]MCK6081148.1 uroporphyrinogen-III synthase [Microbacterium sp. EYE_382]MCK6086418.1 uroporphyrinogen-III synthase [Microbacterium sp. EYE_384]MCK6124084.1 uroporphyrinogen-III synthase [Microbacterium sp. EYE_80]MCK6126993.1 uroporphyrinogen-III synthase [Microbacterium sp. EYE_79]MCK6142103.1 uroporphyrinogen-III synthase [Microbacterium sp. EYE_39]
MTAPSGRLRGARVLVPRAGAWGERVRADLRARGADAVLAPLIGSAPPRNPAARERAFAALAAGEYAWLFVTSAASIEQLRAHGVEVPATTRIAAVGRATARAVADAGWEVDFVPAGQASASALITQWCAARSPESTGRALVVRSDLAQAVVSDELEVRGFAVDVCIAYRTVGIDLAEDVADGLRTGGIDVVLLTSLSVGRELRRQVGPLPASTLVASIGPGTTRDAEALGFRVGHTAGTQSIDALIAELDALVPVKESS